ncbi:hypothetical protein GUD61_004718 [Salmonella enterica]|nr:hypothetical protein [Salmonella enterica]
MRTLIATALPVEYALPVMVSAALMSRLILIPVRRFLTGHRTDTMISLSSSTSD